MIILDLLKVIKLDSRCEHVFMDFLSTTPEYTSSLSITEQTQLTKVIFNGQTPKISKPDKENILAHPPKFQNNFLGVIFDKKNMCLWRRNTTY